MPQLGATNVVTQPWGRKYSCHPMNVPWGCQRSRAWLFGLDPWEGKCWHQVAPGQQPEGARCGSGPLDLHWGMRPQGRAGSWTSSGPRQALFPRHGLDTGSALEPVQPPGISVKAPQGDGHRQWQLPGHVWSPGWVYLRDKTQIWQCGWQSVSMATVPTARAPLPAPNPPRMVQRGNPRGISQAWSWQAAQGFP